MTSSLPKVPQSAICTQKELRAKATINNSNTTDIIKRMMEWNNTLVPFSLPLKYIHVLRMYSRYVKGSTPCSRSIRMFTMLRWIITHTYRFFFLFSTAGSLGVVFFYCWNFNIPTG